MYAKNPGVVILLVGDVDEGVRGVDGGMVWLVEECCWGGVGGGVCDDDVVVKATW